MIRVGIIDDDKVLCKAFDKVCSTAQGLSCIIQLESIASFFLHFDDRIGLDVLILDLHLNDPTEAMGHITKMRRLCGEHLKIIVYLSNIDHVFLKQALDENVNGIVKKDMNLNEVVAAVRMVHKGENYVCNNVTALMFESIRSATIKNQISAIEQRQLDFLREKGLTPREVSIAHKLALGHSYAEIAASFFISINTVRYYIKLIYKKTGEQIKLAYPILY
jgi:DNA-binding NarL/FixJ family response regulator